MSGRWTALLVALVVGCAGGDGGSEEQRLDAYDYDGFWILESVTMDRANTYVRNGAWETGRLGTLRGDMKFTAFADDDARLVGRYGFLSEGVLTGAPEFFSNEVRVDGSIWYLGLEIFDAELQGDRLVLTRRFDIGTRPQRITATRTIPWDDRTVGRWEVVSMLLPDVGRIDAGACVAIESRGVRLEQVLNIDPAWMLDLEQTMTGYSDASCTQIEETRKTVRAGLVEEEGDLLRIWDLDPNAPRSAEFVEFAFSKGRNGNLVLERTNCLPDGCKTTAPTWVTVKHIDNR